MLVEDFDRRIARRCRVQQPPSPRKHGDARGLEVSRGSLSSGSASLSGQIRDRTPKSGVLSLQLLQPLDLVAFEPTPQGRRKQQRPMGVPILNAIATDYTSNRCPYRRPNKGYRHRAHRPHIAQNKNSRRGMASCKRDTSCSCRRDRIARGLGNNDWRY